MSVAAQVSLRALNGFGLGAAPGEHRAVAADPRGWVLSTLADGSGQPAPGLALTSEQAVGHFTRWQAVRRGRARAIAAGATSAQIADQVARPSFADVVEQAFKARLDVATTTGAHLRERLSLFWMDHFTVSSGGAVGFFIGLMDQEAIRPHMLGMFGDLLRSAVLHPAMLFYLDNRNSVGPGSALGVRSRGRRGLNENLGRELLELHTIGVDGGYGQADVVAMAKVLSGWSMEVANGAAGPRVGFFADRHEPGPQTVLGKTYAQEGPDQALAVLDDLARHPATARHVSRRMVRHFVGHGLPGLEERVAGVFLRSGGDLDAVTRALVTDAEAWGAPRKVRSPVELVFATARLLGGLPPQPQVLRALQTMGQPFWAAPSPKGWPAEDEAWAAPDSIKTRLDWASELTARLPATTDARALLEAALGAAASPETRRTVERAADGRQALSLLLLSPEFQRR